MHWQQVIADWILFSGEVLLQSFSGQAILAAKFVTDGRCIVTERPLRRRMFTTDQRIAQRLDDLAPVDLNVQFPDGRAANASLFHFCGRVVNVL